MYRMQSADIKGGQVIGETGDIDRNIVEAPIHINALYAALLHWLSLDRLRLAHRHQSHHSRLTDIAG